MQDTAIKVTALLFSFILSIASFILGAFVIYHLQQSRPNREANEMTADDPQQRKQSTTEKYFHYFAATSQITMICNILCCLSVSMFCVLTITDDNQHDIMWYIAIRSTVGVCWFFAKASLIWLYNGRLYYAFLGSALQSSYTLFIIINIVIGVAAPLCLIFGFVGVYYNIMWLISLGFESFRFIYIILASLLLFMFTNRLLTLQRMVTDHNDVVASNGDFDLLTFVNVASKNAILVLFISISAVLVVIAWAIHDYVLVMNSLALLIPLLMFSFDSVLDSFCIYLLFNFGNNLYKTLCKSCDERCKHLCIRQSQLKDIEMAVGSNNDSNLETKSTDLPTMEIH